MVKKNWFQVSVIVVVLLAACAAGINLPKEPSAVSWAAADTAADTITVQGIGNISASPDWSMLRLGAEMQAETVQEAQSATAEIIARVKTALLEHGADEDLIRTVEFRVQPNYRYENQGERILQGYTVRHILQVEYGDIENIGKLLDDVVKAGANRIDHVQFTVKDQTSLETSALEKAMEHAKIKAEALAKTAGKQIADVHQIHESGAPTGLPIARMAAPLEYDALGTVIEPGQIEIQKSVTVTFIMK